VVNFYYPETLKEALELKASKELIPLAGGTDLMVRYENWSSLPASFPGSVMAVGHLKELQYLREEEGYLCIGGGLPLNELLDYQGLPECLALAVEGIAAPALRNLATLAGNIQNASPAADSLPPLILMDASVRVVSESGSRDIPVGNFMTGPGRTVLAENELIESIRIPMEFIRSEGEGKLSYRKVGTRKANALSKLSVCFWSKAEEGRLKDIRLTLGAVAAVVIRLPEAEKALKGVSLSELEKTWETVRPLFKDAIKPIDDQRSTAFYRKRSALRLLDAFIQETASEL
jgi:CO/xanthine dehydrogenase FAD-binding subunit